MFESTAFSTKRIIPIGNEDTGERDGDTSKSRSKSFSDNDTNATVSVTDGGSSTEEICSARTPWYSMCFLILSEVMGTGILGLPFLAVTLGWTTTMIALPLFAMIAAYAGFQLRDVKLAYPEITNYADAGKELIGPKFGLFTKGCMLLNWGSLAIYFMVATANGIEAVYDKGFFSCNLHRMIIAALLLVVPVQARDFHTISTYLSLPSTLAIIVTLIIMIVALVCSLNDGEDDTTSNTFGEDTTAGVMEGTTVFGFLQALSSIIFAYQGQSIFLELMTEIKDPKNFGKSCNVAYGVMGVVYTSIVAVAYGISGDHLTDFLPDILTAGPAKTTVGVLLVFHILVAYVIAIEPFHFWLHATAFPNTFRKTSFWGNVHWFIITVGYILFAFVIANLIPFFGALQGLIGSLLGAPIVFGWPSLYYPLTHKNKTCGSWKDTFASIGPINTVISLLFLFVITPVFMVMGTWGGINDLITDVGDSGYPFSC